MQTAQDKTQNPENDTVLESPLWREILALVERKLADRRDRKLFVEVEGADGSLRKEIGELTVEERRGLHPYLGGHVAEELLDRHLAEQGCVDLVETRRTYTKNIRDLTPEDLPAILEADRWRAEVEQDLAEFVRNARADLERLPVDDAIHRPLVARVSRA